MTAPKHAMRAAAAALTGALLGVATGASAHALDITTARVTLRDGHVDVAAEVDAAEMVARAAPGAGDAASLAALDDAALAATIDAARRVIAIGAEITVPGRAPLPLSLRAFPGADEVRAAAARRAEAPSPSTHAAGSVIRFEATEPLGTEAPTLRVSLPPAFGRTLATFVQPAEQLVTPGGAATFSVLAPAGPTEPPRRVDAVGRTWPAVAAAACAVVAVLAQLRPRVRARGGAA